MNHYLDRQQSIVTKLCCVAFYGIRRENSVLYLIFYKDASHAAAQKQKSAVQLLDFCGLNALSRYDKAANVLAIVTTTQTYFLSFDSISLRDEWKRHLVNRFGEDSQFSVNIPGKQKLKSGAATLRIYRTFFSIITSKNYVSLGRWYCEDVCRYAALDDSMFSFEIKSPQGRSGHGQQINLAIENAAEDVVKVLDYINQDVPNRMMQTDYHGSGILDELGRGHRDQNFFQRCLLRVSNRVRRHKRERSRSALPPKHHSLENLDQPLSPSSSVSAADESKWRSLERKKNPDISINLDEKSRDQMLAIKSRFYRQKSDGGRLSVEMRASESSQEGRSSQSSPRKSANASVSSAYRNIDDDRRGSDLVFADNKFSDPKQPRNGLQFKSPVFDSMNNIKNNSSVEDISRRTIVSEEDGGRKPEQKRSVDSLMTNITRHNAEVPRPLKSRTKPGKKKHKSESDSQPTPPPRSPVSLGLTEATTFFEFPSADDLKKAAAENGDSVSVTTRDSDDVSLSTKNSIDGDLERDNLHSDFEIRRPVEDLNVIDELSGNSDSEGQLPPPLPKHSNQSADALDGLPAPSVTPYKFEAVINHSEPVYGNIDPVTRQPIIERERLASDEDALSDVPWRQSACNRDPSKHSSDPLDLDNWRRITGEGAHMSAGNDNFVKPTDYVNLKGKNKGSDDEHGSYVNVSGPSNMNGRKKPIPSPLTIKGSSRNDFTKYDDEEDGVVYQYFTSSQDSIRKDGSYENMNGLTRPGGKRTDYHNLMSPKAKSSSGSLNYVVFGGSATSVRPGHGYMSNNSSPINKSPAKGPSKGDKVSGSEYTRIDENLTEALQQSKLQLEKQRQERQLAPKTPAKKSKP